MGEDMEEKDLDFIEGVERRKYAAKHGLSSLINMYHGLPWIGEEAERVYKICNDKGITWEEYYGIKNKNASNRIY